MKNKITSILIGALMAGAAISSLGQDKQTLDLLVSKGVITRAEADSLTKSSVSVSPKEKSVKSIKLTGRVQTQYEYISVDEYANGQETSFASKNDFIMRRVFLGMSADLGAGWSASIVADFARADAGYLDSVYIEKKVDWDYLNGNLKLGYQKINFALEENTSSSKLYTVERSLTTRYFTEGNNGRRLGLGGRHTGAFWSGKILELDGLTYGASITNSYNNSPTSFASNADNALLYAANIAYAAKFDDVSFTAGVNFAYTNGMNVAGSAGSVHSSVVGVNPYVKLSALGLDLWSDFLCAQVDDGKNSFTENTTPMGVNVAAEYKFDIGDLGKIAPTLRYSWIDTDGRGIKMSDGVRNSNGITTYNAAQSIYVGLNWYIQGNDVKFQLGYEWAQTNGSPKDSSAAIHSDANAVRAQMQILF